MNYRIFPPEGILETTVSLPLSKSISARALVMAYLTPGVSTLPTDGIADCADTAILRHVLESHRSGVANVGACGTAMRFLTALYASMPGHVCTLDGSERMRQRPVGPLVDALRAMGANIEYLGETGYPPLKITGMRLSGGHLEMDAGQSSQFVSALMMVAPTMENELEIRLLGNVQSLPYIRMTAEMMRRRGVEVDLERDSVRVANSPYCRCVDDSEPDWSAATFWYEIAALTAGWVTVEDLRKDALQGDREIAPLFKRIGVLTDYTDEGAELSATPDLYSRMDMDMTDMPDAVPAVAVSCAALGIPFRLTGVGALHHKECDRLEAIRNELLKIGIVAEYEKDDIFVWEGARVPVASMPEIETYNDHRIAMAFAPLSVFLPGIVIRDAEVVDKSYPDFWKALLSAGFSVADADVPDSDGIQNGEAEA